MGGLGRVSLSIRPASEALAVRGRGARLATRCSPASAANMPAGAFRRAGQGYFALGSGPARALARVEPLLRRARLSRPCRQRAVLVLEADRPPPPPVVDKVAEALRRAARPTHLPLRADAEPRRHGADRRARARGRPAQGARAALPARAHRRRHRHRAAPAARARFHHRHGPHQRRHHLWRPRAALRARRRQGGEGACRQSAEPHVAGLRPAVRRHLRGGEGRFLRDRPACCSARRGDRDGARDRRELRSGASRHRRPVDALSPKACASDGRPRHRSVRRWARLAWA